LASKKNEQFNEQFKVKGSTRKTGMLGTPANSNEKLGETSLDLRATGYSLGERQKPAHDLRA
jgi:hypothetical protein